MQRRTRGVGAQHEQRRRQIADAVLAVVADRGLQAVSLNEVALQAGVSPGRVQHYFPTRQRLIEAAFERGNELSSARIAAKTGTTTSDTQTGGGPDAAPGDVLTVVLTELLPYDHDTWAHMRVRQAFTALALSDETIAARLRADYARLHAQIADLIAREQTHHRILDPTAEAVALVALAEGLAYYVLIGVQPVTAARHRLLAAITALST
ncbi:TetR/AcrR family transcriptional regulator [Thermomonospora umbrina]|uniref:TetR family transcriptional regulator n=1 Tax=Thermomonospora umbrina TaxID=111806 RepID=A0A3D9SX26_9ACTN|nr:TetR/AcrR family transcriptional regulator [Thermomonospora umbrina]REF00513.1 TetR family transcriptional regulator [Thermomonospora umbrina]